MPNNSNQIFRIEYTSEFKRNLRTLAKKYRFIRGDIQPFIDHIKSGQFIGKQVKGVGDIVYKARVKNSDIQKGKSAGYRVIYWIKTPQDIILITLYSKLDQADSSPQQIRRIIRQAEQGVIDE
jgi:mRNA-degrading endonuclease RelE of RelBE toxin-antitoxin system